MELESTERINKTAVYRELHNEMRRYRDYELNSSKWYSPMLLAILGYILKDKMFVTSQIGPQGSLTYNYWFMVIVLFITFFIVVASIHGVWYAHKRLVETRNIVERLAPEWKEFNLSKKIISPRHFIYFIQIILGISIFITILIFNK